MVPKLLLIAIFGVHQITLAKKQLTVVLPEKTELKENIYQKQESKNDYEESKLGPITFRQGYSIIGQNDSVDQRSEYKWGTNTLGNDFVQLPEGESKSKAVYTTDNLGYHPVVRLEVKNNQSELTSHFAIGENAVKSLNEKNGAKVVSSSTVNSITDENDIIIDDNFVTIKNIILKNKDNNITSSLIQKSDDDKINVTQKSLNNATNTKNNNNRRKTSTKLNLKTNEEVEDVPSDEEDSMFFFNKSLRDMFKNRFSEYISNASKSHPEIFKTSKAVPHMNEVFHYFDVHPVSDNQSDYRGYKKYNTNQNNYPKEDFNAYQSVSGFDNWISEYLESTKPPEIYSNNSDDLQALPTHISQIKNMSKVSNINETKFNISILYEQKQNESQINLGPKDIVSDFTGYVSDEDVININDAAEEYFISAESRNHNVTINSIPFLPTINSFTENFKSFGNNDTFNSPIIVRDNFDVESNTTEEYLEDNVISDSNAVHSNTYLNTPEEIQIIPSPEKFINIPRSESMKQINVEILKEPERMKSPKKLFTPTKELDESHENEERNFSKEKFGPITEAPSRKFLKNFSPKYNENRDNNVEFSKVAESNVTTPKENLIVTPNLQYKTLPPPLYSATEPALLSSTTESTIAKTNARGRTFVEIQKSVNVHNMLIQEQDGKLIEQHEEYRKPYNFGQKLIQIESQPQKITQTFSTRQPIVVYDERSHSPVTVSHPSEVLPAPYPVQKQKEYITIEKKIPIYISTSTPYPVKVFKPFSVDKIVENPIKVTEKVPFYIDRPYPVKTVVEKKVEVPVEKIVEKYIDRPYPVNRPYPVQITVEKIIEKKVPIKEYVKVPYPVEVPQYVPNPYPVEKVVEKFIDRPVEKIVEKEIKVPYPVVVKKVVEKPVEKIVERPVPYAVPIRVEIPVDRPYRFEKTVSGPVEKPVKVEIEKIVEKPIKVEVEKVVEKFVDRPVTVEKVVEKIVDRPITVEKIFNRAILIPVQVPVPYAVPTASTYQSPRDFHSHNTNYFGKANALHTDFQLPIVNNHYPTTELYKLLQPTPPHQNALNFYNQLSVPISPQKSPVPVTILSKRPAYSFSPKYSSPLHAMINNVRYAKNFAYKPLLPAGIVPHTFNKMIANDYIGPVPAESEKSYWVVAPGPGSRGLYKRSSDFEKNLRVEYGFKPPLVPSVEIDDQGNPIGKKD